MRSAREVNPTRSAKTTVMTRRSSNALLTGDDVKGAPHRPQNLNPAWFSAPHDPQIRSMLAPQAPQNACPAAFSCPHAVQTWVSVTRSCFECKPVRLVLLESKA